MKTITLDFTGIKTHSDLHDYFQEIFDLPDYYGRNIDALWDCLQCSFHEETTIVLNNLLSLPDEMHPAIADLFEDLEHEEDNVTVQITD